MLRLGESYSSVKANLKSLNLTNYGNLTSGELGTCSNEKMELFYNDEVKGER